MSEHDGIQPAGDKEQAGNAGFEQANKLLDLVQPPDQAVETPDQSSEVDTDQERKAEAIHAALAKYAEMVTANLDMEQDSDAKLGDALEGAQRAINELGDDPRKAMMLADLVGMRQKLAENVRLREYRAQILRDHAQHHSDVGPEPEIVGPFMQHSQVLSADYSTINGGRDNEASYMGLSMDHLRSLTTGDQRSPEEHQRVMAIRRGLDGAISGHAGRVRQLDGLRQHNVKEAAKQVVDALGTE